MLASARTPVKASFPLRLGRSSSVEEPGGMRSMVCARSALAARHARMCASRFAFRGCYESEARAEHRAGDGSIDRIGTTVVPDARRQDGGAPREQPETHLGLLPKLDRAGPAPAGGLRDVEPGGDECLL